MLKPGRFSPQFRVLSYSAKPPLLPQGRLYFCGMETETRMFVGDTATHAFDGYAGFRIGQLYQLRFTRDDDQVAIELDHGAPGAFQLVVSEAQFAKCWVKR